MQDTEKKDASALEVPQREKNEAKALSEEDTVSRINEKNFERAVKRGFKTPAVKVLLRLLLALLIVSALAMFFTGIMKYNELTREREVLEVKRDALEEEIAELQYLIDCPVNYDYIVRVAREKLGLHLPDEIVYYNDAKE